MRRTIRHMSAAIAVLVLLMVPTTAHASAGVPLPGPVDEIADIPSRVARSVTSSPVGDSVAREMLEAQKVLIALRRAQDAGAAVSLAPKPITAPAAIARGAGAPLMAVMAGWAIASNGTLALTGLATDSSYQTVYCNQPEWYQATTQFVNLSFAPDCKGDVVDPNTDTTQTTSISYGGSTLTLTGRSPSNSPSAGSGTVPVGWPYRWCYTGAIPSGVVVQGQNTVTGAWFANPANPTTGGTFSCAVGGFHVAAFAGSGSTAFAYSSAIRYASSTTGAVVASSVTTGADPLRTPRCSIDWEDATTTTGTGTPYRESEGLPLSSAGLGCEEAFVSKPGRGPNLMPSRIGVESESDTGAITEISDQEVPEFGPDERKVFETGNGRGLVLEKVAGTVMTSCMTWAADCSGWWASTDEGTSTGTYRCTYGGSQIALVECGAYRYTFDTQTSTPTITDPVTGTQTPWTTQPATGNSISPGTGPGTGANPTGECFAAGWSAFNPIEWILTPFKCALVWAFVPRQAVVDETVRHWDDEFNNSVLGSVAGGLGALGGAYGSMSGCGGLPFHLEGFGVVLVHTHLLNACEEPAAGVATIVRLLLTFAAIGGALLAIMRYLGSVFAFAQFGKSSHDDNGGGVKFK